MYRRELVAILIFVVLIMLNNSWIIFTQKSQDDKIHRLDAKLSHEAQVSDENSAGTLLERIKQLERNMTDRLAQLTRVQEELNKTKRELNEATGRITELEQNFMVLEARKVNKTEFEILSHNLTILRESTSREDEEIREDLTELADTALNQTDYDQLQDGIDRLEESKADQTALEVVAVTLSELANSTITILKTVDGIKNTTQILEGHTLQLETEVDSARAAIADLNITKASKEDLSHLTTEIMVLEGSKVDKTDFQILSHNLTLLRESTSREDEEIREDLAGLADTALNQTHYDQLQDGIDRLEESKADQTALQVVASTVSELANSTVRNSETVDGIENTIVILERGVAELNATKASKEDLRQLTTDLMLLVSRKVDRMEFELLSGNLTLLRESLARDYEEIYEDLAELSGSALNYTHHDQLQRGIDRLEASKANQTALEEVVLTVSNLENSTVSISKLVVQVALNVTTLEQHTREALTTKADQRDIDSLSDRLTALTDTTETFERLEDRVETLSTNKAEQSDLNELKGTVDHLDATCAREYKVDQLEGRVTSHIKSSDNKHEELASDISDNDGSIQINSRRIGNVENAIQQDDTETSAASHVLTSSWMITIVTLVTITINTCVYTCTLHL